MTFTYLSDVVCSASTLNLIFSLSCLVVMTVSINLLRHPDLYAFEFLDDFLCFRINGDN